MPVARPYPSSGLTRAVAAHLNPRRTIGTRVEVTGPSYLEVTVQAQVRAHAGASKTQVRQAVVDALNAFLDPLRGGPDKTGWPFGRDVYRSEILQTIDGTEDVDRVESLTLFADGCGPLCGNICLRPVWLVTPGAHRIEVV
jgi:predicted phage baseplate assembly protein